MSESATQFHSVPALAAALRRDARATRQRRALLLSGSASWCRAEAETVAAQFSSQQCLWIRAGDATPGGTLQYLGGEAELVIYDAHHGFDADTFGAVCGVITGGGLLLLLTPPLALWPGLRDPEAERFFCAAEARPSLFIQRFIARAQQAEGVTVVTEEGGLPPVTLDEAAPAPPLLAEGPYRSADQARAVAAIVKVARGHRRRPLVLISDRGRGKSSALGLAAARLLREGLKRIIVTGPRLDAVAPVFQHAGHQLPGSHVARGLIETGTGRLEYMAPDELIAARPAADLLLVDEAAAIPTPMLDTLLAQHARIAFATTVHGYEGTGRGFALRFNQVLDRETPGWRQLRLQQAIRWADNDALERFVFDALLLDAGIAAEAEVGMLTAADCHAERIHRDQLGRDETLLSELFGLLVLAHYRTRPNDLRQLLDSPALQIHALRHDGHLLAVALLLEEGGLEARLGTQIYLGRRRLHGHLLPQSLAFHAGLREAPTLRYLRLMRIAVHPAVQRRGLGSRLVSEIIRDVDAREIDCLGTSFGLSAGLLRFWQRLGFVPARLGLTREQSSASHSLIMLRPVSQRGRCLGDQAHAHLQAQLPEQLSDALRDFDAALAAQLLQGGAVPRQAMARHDWEEVISFARGNRGYEFCMAAIVKAVIPALADPTFQPAPPRRQLLISKVLQKQPWNRVVEICGLPGRAAAVKLLRETLQQLVTHYCPPDTRAAIEASLDL